MRDAVRPPGDPDLETDVLVAIEADGELCLLVSHHDVVASHPLGAAAAVTLGRSSRCDVVIDHPSVSRVHAELTAQPLTVRDLDSRNGTRLRGERLPGRAAVPIAVGEAFQVGDAVVVVQRAAPGGGRAWRGVLLDGRLAEECARSARSGATFAFARVHVDPSADHAQVAAHLEVALRGTDLFADAGQGQLQILLIETAPTAARAALERVIARLRGAGLSPRWGLATWPRDGTTAEQLAAHAWNALRAPGGVMEPVRALIEQIADSALAVLVRGETGVGKALCAEMIHRLSGRARRPFVRLHCGSLSEPMLERELFGHERGAFPGASATRPGLIERAGGGTLFLDEVGELPLALQARLLRVLEDRAVVRLGAISGQPVDVRVVAATSRSLEADLASGRFRRDLYFRLAGVTVEVPPLRERQDEIDGLIEAFVARAAAAAQHPPPAVSDAARAALRQHGWPGNVRELRNTIERAVLGCGPGPLELEHLELSELDGTITSPGPRLEVAPAPAAAPAPIDDTLRGEVARLEARRIGDALSTCGGNQTRAARLLGISRNTLQAKMDTFGIPRPRKG